MRILYDPEPRKTAEIFSEDHRKEFFGNHTVFEVNPKRRQADYQEFLPRADVVIGQQPLPRERLDSAPGLRAIFNVETNFLPNIDYDLCFERGIHVLAPSSVFAVPVAEMGLGMALSLARGIHTGHSDFVAGKEKYSLSGNPEAELLTGADMGFIGFGDLGRALHRLLVPFNPRLLAFDPWLPDDHLRRLGVEAASLEEVLGRSRVLFVVASVTTENRHLIDRQALAKMQDGSMLILLSRAALADFAALAAEAASGRLRIATDVFPEEPAAKDDPIRQTPGMLLSAHRAGGLVSALQSIGALVLEDLSLISRGLPPVSCRRAERETVGRMRSKPIEQI